MGNNGTASSLLPLQVAPLHSFSASWSHQFQDQFPVFWELARMTGSFISQEVIITCVRLASLSGISTILTCNMLLDVFLHGLTWELSYWSVCCQLFLELSDSQSPFGCASYTQEAITHSYFKHMHKYSMLKKHCASVHSRDDLLLLTATNVLCIGKLPQWLILGWSGCLC